MDNEITLSGWLNNQYTMRTPDRNAFELERLYKLANTITEEWVYSDESEYENRLNSLHEEVCQMIREQKQNIQSRSVTTRSHFTFEDKHSEQLPESRLTRQRLPDDLQFEQGEGMSRPKRRTRPNKFERRVVKGALGMTGQKREHENVLEGDSAHYLYPREQPLQGYYGYRDAILEEEGAVSSQLSDDTLAAE